MMILIKLSYDEQGSVYRHNVSHLMSFSAPPHLSLHRLLKRILILALVIHAFIQTLTYLALCFFLKRSKHASG